MIVAPGPRTAVGDEAVLAAHDPGAGVVVIAAPPAATRAQIDAEVLNSLGKPWTGMAQSEPAAKARRSAVLWLRAHEAGHLVVLGAHRLDAAGIAELAAVEDASGAEVVLLADDRQVGRVLAASPRATLAGAEWKPPSGRAPEAPRPPRAPGGGGPTAGPRGRAFLLGLAAAATIEPARRRDRRGVSEALWGAMSALADPACRLAFADGAVWGLADWGWELEYERSGVLEGRSAAQSRRLDGLPLERLAVFVSPATPTALTLAHLGLDQREILGVRRRDAATDGSAVAVAGEIVEVPRTARVHIRAQLILGSDEGWGPETPLLGPRAELGRHNLLALVEAGAAEAGLALRPQDFAAYRSSIAERRLAESGVRLASVAALPWCDASEADVLRAEVRALAAAVAEVCGCPDAHPAPDPGFLESWPLKRSRKNHPWDNLSGRPWRYDPKSGRKPPPGVRWRMPNGRLRDPEP